ncbi:Rap1a/Tai family immunity protein [Sphingopyxis sp. GC21]|uniref:Rap1a/Tai family immunity protein n=1 Tax=Sphingopyxis sp. GC21 TaxID=2933562 RepID=UPI0021E37502|nr:Rap1a/Tai family immunity protein [Sphingopyxis sp. GC21]
MNMSHWVGACLVSIALATPSHAQEQPTQGNGAALVANCRANSPVCGAYLQGVLDMMIVARRDECAAPRYDRSAMRTAYLRWADANGYFLDVHMVAGAQRALEEAWPCKQQVGKSSRK